MYTIYRTGGLILNTYDRGEANKLLSILTPDLGRIVVHAQGIRNVQSKLRFGVTQFSHPDIEIVRGRGTWKLVGVTPQNWRPAHHVIPAVHRIGSLIERLTAGEEEANPDLYHDVMHLIRVASEARLSRRELQLFEMMLVMRILSRLGYWDGDLEALPGSHAGLRAYFQILNTDRAGMLTRINESLRATDLY